MLRKLRTRLRPVDNIDVTLRQTFPIVRLNEIGCQGVPCWEERSVFTAHLKYKRIV